MLLVRTGPRARWAADPSANMATKELVTTRTVDNATPAVGSEVMFTLTMVNDGSSDATGVELTDALPSGYTHVSDAASVGTYVPATGLWTIGALGNGVTATLAIRATVNASGTYLNTATAAGGDKVAASGMGDIANVPIPIPRPTF